MNKMDEKVAAVILAAGKGTRMKSQRPKVLHPLGGLPLAVYPARLARDLGCSPVALVVGHGAEAVSTALAEEELVFAEQLEQLGTGHALLCAEAALHGFSGTLLLLCGDVPLLRRETLERLLTAHRAAAAAVTVLTAEMADPYGYGRIVRENGDVARIVEEKDAAPAEKAICEINTGIYALAAPWVFAALRRVGRDNAQGEYYLTDIVGLARGEGRRVCAVIAGDAAEAMGINDRVQLAEAATILRRRLNEEHMRAGVTLLDPATTYIEAGVVIGPDTILHPGVHLRGETVIGSDCEIEPGAMLSDCTLADRVHVKAGSVLAGATIGAGSAIGPMAHLRPGTVLLGGNKIGNFVETKKVRLGFKSQASHLTYIGDAEVGERVNFGCGTITCNYDGVNKFQTTIGDDVFIGSDVQFIAPVTIGSGSLIGAGSTITKDVPPDALAITRAEQKNIAGWAAKKRAKQKKQD